MSVRGRHGDEAGCSFAGQAVRRVFASGQFSGDRVLDAYLQILTRASPQIRDLRDSHYEEVRFSIGPTGEVDLEGKWSRPSAIGPVRRGGFHGRLEVEPAELSRLVAIHSLLSGAHYTCVDPPGYPGATLSFHPGGEPLPEERLLMSREKPFFRPYCFAKWPERQRKAWEEIDRLRPASISE